MFAIAVVACAAFVGCIRGGNKGEGGGTTPVTTKGTIDLATIEVGFEDGTSQITDDYQVTVTSASGEVVARGTLANLSEVSLPEGEYKISVSSAVAAPVADWERPYYVAESSITVEKETTSAVGRMVAELKNVGVQVVFTDRFKAVMGDDCKVSVVLGVGQLTYTKNESRTGYFRATGSNMLLTAELSGTLDGKSVKEQRIIKDVHPGDRKQIVYDIKESENPGDNTGGDNTGGDNTGGDNTGGDNTGGDNTGGDNTGGDNPGDEPDVPVVPEDGNVNLDFKVDVTVKDVDVNGNIIVDENDQEPDNGEGGDNGGNEGGEDGGDEPTPPQGPTDLGEPTIVWEGHNLDEWFELTDSSVAVALNITVPNTISTMTVDIISDASAFQPDALKGVGLDTHLDLSNPGDLRGPIEGLGFPVAENVVGKTELVFDISEFMPLMVVAQGKRVEFCITLNDAFGHQLVKSLKLNVNLN